jgi:hypothetical protein
LIKNLLIELRNKTRLNQRAGIFLSCLIIAVAFWFFTSMSRTYESNIAIPVTYKNLPFTQNIDGTLPTEIKFYFKGTGFELFGLHLMKLPDSLILDIAAIKSNKFNGRYPTELLVQQLKKKLKPIKIVPDFISPTLTDRKGKKIPVRPNISIQFRDRFGAAGKIILKPDSIEIAGPDSLLNFIVFIETDDVVLTDIHLDHFGGVNLNKAALPQNVQLSQPYIHYLIPVFEFTEGSLELPVQLPLSYQNKITLLPAKVNVTFMVELGRYGRIKPEDFVIIAELPDSKNLPPSLAVKLQRKPAGVRNVKISPLYLNYLIRQ